MGKIIRNSWALFTGYVIIMISHGFQGNLLGIRAVLENFNFIKDIYFWNNSKRNIIGLYYNNIQSYNPSSDPFKKIIRKEPINEEVKSKCKSKWEECTNFNICNEMFNLN